jgi:AcrR family transcriptional regulator
VKDRGATDRYHHGDLRNALVDAAAALAREGGPEAVVLRETARRVGVSAAAAYHHFASREELVQAVKQRALALMGARMHSALTRIGGPVAARGADPASAADAARRRLHVLAAAYPEFAYAEPGLFRLIADPRGKWPTIGADDSHKPGDDPFRLLSETIDELAAAGAIPRERRAGLENVVWAAVHGIAVLCLDGPLASATAAERERITDQTLATVIRGL